MKNYMEVLVAQHLPLVIVNDPHIKSCKICQNDILAMTLNNVKPLYINNERGLVFTKLKELDQQFQSDIIRELVQATDKVSKSPQCKK